MSPSLLVEELSRVLVLGRMNPNEEEFWWPFSTSADCSDFGEGYVTENKTRLKYLSDLKPVQNVLMNTF